MSTPAYHAIAFLEKDADFSLQQAKARLAKPLSGTMLTILVIDGSKLTISIEGWRLALDLNERPDVVEESRDMAREFPECPRASDIARCRRRVDVWSEDPDPDLEHINDFIAVCDVLTSFQGVILFDPASGELL